MPLLLIVPVVAAVAVTVRGAWWLTPQAADWGGIDAMLTATTAVVGLAFVVIHVVLAYAIYRYASRAGHRASPEHENSRLEWTLIGVTALGIVALLAPGLLVYGRAISPPGAAKVVEVVGQQWSWSYRYPGEDGRLGAARDDLFGAANPMGVDPEDAAVLDDRWVAGGSLVLPVGEPVRLQLRSRDVIHIFFVPQFRLKMAAMPGMLNEIWITPREVGDYDAVCTEFCGVLHHGMVGRVRVVEREEYDAWLAGQPRVGRLLGLVADGDEAATAGGAEAGQDG